MGWVGLSWPGAGGQADLQCACRPSTEGECGRPEWCAQTRGEAMPGLCLRPGSSRCKAHLDPLNLKKFLYKTCHQRRKKSAK